MTREKYEEHVKAAELLFGFFGRWIIEKMLPESGAEAVRWLNGRETCEFVGGRTESSKKLDYKTLHKEIDAKRFPPPDRKNGDKMWWKQTTLEQYVDGNWHH
jgi:hypothetical protein